MNCANYLTQFHSLYGVRTFTNYKSQINPKLLLPTYLLTSSFNYDMIILSLTTGLHIAIGEERMFSMSHSVFDGYDPNKYRWIFTKIVNEVLNGLSDNCLWNDKYGGVNLPRLTEILSEYGISVKQVVDAMHESHPEDDKVGIEDGHLAVHMCIDGWRLLSAVAKVIA